MESTSSAVTMCATVLRVCPCELCVCDHENCQQVLVHTDNACCFRVGQQAVSYTHLTLPTTSRV